MVRSYCIDIADGGCPYEATVTMASGRQVVASGSTSAYEVARAAFAAAWLMDGGHVLDLDGGEEAADDHEPSSAGRPQLTSPARGLG